MAKASEKVGSFGRVIVYGNPNYRYTDETGWTKDEGSNKATVCEVYDIQDIDRDRIVTSRYVLPLSDALISTSDEGPVYSYNCSLPYLTETAHLAEVEKNMIIGQAFLYPGRSGQNGKTSPLIWALVGILGLIALIGSFT